MEKLTKKEAEKEIKEFFKNLKEKSPQEIRIIKKMS